MPCRPSSLCCARMNIRLTRWRSSILLSSISHMDGNGRMGRFLMNTMMAAAGYPWTVIPLSERKTYMAAPERASVEGKHRTVRGFPCQACQGPTDRFALACDSRVLD
jgi:hypothetical protein